MMNIGFISRAAARLLLSVAVAVSVHFSPAAKVPENEMPGSDSAFLETSPGSAASSSPSKTASDRNDGKSHVQPTVLVPTDIGMAENEPIPVKSKSGVDLTLYGGLVFTAAYDTQTMRRLNTAYWVEREGAYMDDDEAGMTANQSFVGLELKGPDRPSGQTRGKIEFDFYGGGAENMPNPRLRLAFVRAEMKRFGLDLFAGLRRDLVAPLDPPSLDFGLLADAGNFGYRRPMIGVEKSLGSADPYQHRLVASVSLARSLDVDLSSTNEFATRDEAADAGFPTFQARLEYSYGYFPRDPENRLVIGLAAHWNQIEFDMPLPASDIWFTSYSAAIDLTIPLTRSLTFTGEYWYAKNAPTYYGGIGQGINLTDLDEIHSRGGWGAFEFRLGDIATFAIGGGVDNPVNIDLEPDMRTRNAVGFVNLTAPITAAATAGVECSYRETAYYRSLTDASGKKSDEIANGARFLLSIRYRF